MKKHAMAWVALLSSVSACTGDAFPKRDSQTSGALLELAELQAAGGDVASRAAPFLNRFTVTDAGVELVRMFEGSIKCRHDSALHCAYDDASDYCTIGYGHLVATKPCASVRAELRQARFDRGISESEAISLLRDDLMIAQRGVELEMSGARMGLTGLTESQYDALVSFVFNVGSRNFSESTLLRQLKARRNFADSEEVAYQFSRWVRSGGVVLPGLVTRRRLEAEHFFTGFDTFGGVVPRSVDPLLPEDDIVDIRVGEPE